MTAGNLTHAHSRRSVMRRTGVTPNKVRYAARNARHQKGMAFERGSLEPLVHCVPQRHLSGAVHSPGP